jgi:hypothetical protein
MSFEQFIINQKDLKASEGSHIPLLIEVLKHSEGPVLELGTGLNSTPVIHWLCNKKREVDSYESSPMFYRAAWNYHTDWHRVNKVEDWDKDLTIDRHWGVVFIDHAPGIRRNVEMGRVANNADFVIVHDTEPKSDWHYKYSNHFADYKYRYDFTDAYPHTSVFSNFKDLSFLCDLMK